MKAAAAAVAAVAGKSDMKKQQQQQEATKISTLKRRRNLGLLDYELERRSREEQLTTVLNALAFLESKLKNEQQIIRRKLCEKDEVINRQMCTIRNMKRKYGDTDVEENAGAIAQYCPHCRKNYYLQHESKTAWTQTLTTDDYTLEGKVFSFKFNCVFSLRNFFESFFY